MKTYEELLVAHKVSSELFDMVEEFCSISGYGDNYDDSFDGVRYVDCINCLGDPDWDDLDRPVVQVTVMNYDNDQNSWQTRT